MQFDDLYSKFIAETYDRQSLVENPANAYATIGNWFPGFELKSNAMSASKRYAHDAEIKTMIKRQFGDYLTRFWQEHA
jgi:hypothetical protein